jgi:hypothetical protein
MYHFMRTILLSIFLLSTLIVIPYAFFSYVCYAGICGGELAATISKKPYFVTLYGCYIWLYPLIGLIVTIYSKKLKNKFFSLLLLIVPFLCGIPLAYIYHQEKIIKAEISASKQAYFQPTPADFICSRDMFIRINNPTSMTVFNNFYNEYGVGHSTIYFNSYTALTSHLLRKNIELATCKNANNVSLSNFFQIE